MMVMMMMIIIIMILIIIIMIIIVIITIMIIMMMMIMVRTCTRRQMFLGKPAGHMSCSIAWETLHYMYNFLSFQLPSRQSPTPAVDILNTCVVKQPKTLADKKSEFLNSLRKDTAQKDDGNDGSSLLSNEQVSSTRQ